MTDRMTLFDRGLDLLRERKVYFAEKFIPQFMASYACHCFNLRNRKACIYYEHGKCPDCRLHLLMVAPPGFSKSLFMHQCFDPQIGLFYTPTIQTAFEGSCTEAGWVGTYEKLGSTKVKSMGLAEEYKSGVVSIEEFTAITQALQQKHSLTFEAQLNSSLFGGDVRKRLGSGPIQYHTDVTLIAGTQVTKFDVSGGLGRRFNYIYWVPSPSEFAQLRQAVIEGANVPLNKSALDDYRKDVMKFNDDLINLKQITFSKDLYDHLNGRPHFEYLVYRKIALGYNLLMADKIPQKMDVTLDGRLKDMLSQAMLWRSQLLADPEAAQVLELLKHHGGRMKKEDLFRALLDYSINWENANFILGKLLAMNKVRRNWNTGDIEVV